MAALLLDYAPPVLPDQSPNLSVLQRPWLMVGRARSAGSRWSPARDMYYPSGLSTVTPACMHSELAFDTATAHGRVSADGRTSGARRGTDTRRAIEPHPDGRTTAGCNGCTLAFRTDGQTAGWSVGCAGVPSPRFIAHVPTFAEEFCVTIAFLRVALTRRRSPVVHDPRLGLKQSRSALRDGTARAIREEGHW